MSTPEPPSNTAAPAAPAASNASGSTATVAPETAASTSASTSTKPEKPANPLGTAGYKPKPPPEPLTGWRSAFEHTGIPRSVLTAKPRIPSRNWCIFLGIVGTITYLYKDDRRRAERIRNEYIDKVKYLSEQPVHDTQEMPRKVKVYGARWPEDDESDRSLRHFRKYIKPYLVAAAIDYEQVHAPLYGSIARIVRADTVKKRRQSLGLEPYDPPKTIEAAMDPAADFARQQQRVVEGGTILVGRPALKEYFAGLRAGWSNSVNEWVWEKEVEKEIKDDGFFDVPEVEVVAAVPHVDGEVQAAPAEAAQPAEPAAAPASAKSVFGFLSRKPAATPTPSADSAAPAAPEVQIPESMHAAPSPLPPQAPLVLVPFTCHLGFKQIPYMIYDFFTESRRVQQGAEVAYALIMNHTRPFTIPTESDHPDTDFAADTEQFYTKSYATIPEKNEKAKGVYYKELGERLESARQFARGERDLTDAEKKSDKPVTTEDDLKEERKKREMRWNGGLEGWNIVKAETPVAWDPTWAGWLRVVDPEVKDE